MIGPQRRTERRRHLDAGIGPVEHALIEVANRSMEASITAVQKDPDDLDMEAAINAVVSQRLRDVAEELRFW
jgi:hypothetical protein